MPFNIQAQGLKEFNPVLIAQVAPPQSRTVTGGTPEVVYDNTKNQRLAKIYIQNIGTSAIKYALNDVATAGLFNGILAACTASEDGLGSGVEIDCANRKITKITLFSATDYSYVATFDLDPRYPLPPA